MTGLRRVAHVITGLQSGGAERVLTRVVASDAFRDVEQTVYSLSDEGFFGGAVRDAGARLVTLDLARPRIGPAALARLSRDLRAQRPQVVMTWLYHADLVGTLGALAAGVAPRRIVWNVRCSDIDFSRYSWTTRAVATALARLSRLPGAVACNSRAGITAHERMGYRPRRWVHLPNGFDLDAWRPDAQDRRSVRAELGLGEHEIALATVARSDPQKDYPTLLEAFARAAEEEPRLRLVVIGRDTERLVVPHELRQRARLLGERSDVARLLRGTDVFCLASAYGEGFPNVIGEAMATGLRCIVTDVGDAADVVGPYGVVVPPKAPEALADAIVTTARGQPFNHEAAHVRERIAQHFELSAVCSRYRELLEELGA